MISFLSAIAALLKAIPPLAKFGNALLDYIKEQQQRNREAIAVSRKARKDDAVDAAIDGVPDSAIGKQPKVDAEK